METLQQMCKTKRHGNRRRWPCTYYCVIVVLILVTLLNIYIIYGSSLIKGSPKKTRPSKQIPVYKLQVNHNFTNDVAAEDRFKTRNDVLASVCRSNIEEYDHYMSLCQHSRRAPPMYCTKSIEPGLAGYLIDHNAVSILKNVLYRAMKPGRNGHNNPYLVDEKDFSILREDDTNNLSFHEFWNLQNITRFTFVRDPYTRLLSSYLDSLYISNPLQWRLLAKVIRPDDPRLCVTDITFREYVDYFLKLIRDGNCPERLLMLNFQQADPCKVKYHFVGKFEQLEKDITHIIKHANLSVHFSFPHFQTDGDTMQITVLVKKIFDDLKDIKACGMNLESALKRMWHRLQAKGILGIYDLPPRGIRDDNQQSTIQTTVIKDYLLGNMYGREENKDNALKEAYSQLSESTIAELQHVFQLELKLFGYNIYPEYIQLAKDYMNVRGKVFSFFDF